MYALVKTRLELSITILWAESQPRIQLTRALVEDLAEYSSTRTTTD
jgi:hypothetical protein